MIKSSVKQIKLSDIEQGSIVGSCVLLALAPDNLSFQKKANGKIAFQFHDRLTGDAEWVTVKANNWRSSARASSEAIERAYGKWLKREGIVDEDGLTGLAAVANGNNVEDVALDVTGRGARAYDPNEAVFSAQPTVVLSGTNSQYFAINHVYRVLGSNDGNVFLFNPWRYDGREIIGADDGFLTMPSAQFASDFVGWGYSLQ